MKFYEAGNSSNPVILLIPGTCCHYSLFNKVLPLLQEKFYTVMASFDGFDESEKSEYISMDDEALKIEKYINERFSGHISTIYGCSLGGSFAGYLLNRNNIKIDHIILGSSDLDHSNKLTAAIKGKIITPILHKIIHSGFLPKALQKELNNLKQTDLKRWEQMNEFLNSFMVPELKNIITKKSIYNQYVSDLTTKIGMKIYQENSKVHIFYATLMGKKYLKRYENHFKNPDIRKQNLNLETFFFCYPNEWVKEVFDCVF